MKCMITGKEFDEGKQFPPPSTDQEKQFGVKAARDHAEEASKWRHVQLLVDGKEVLAGHVAPDVDPARLTISSGK
jgi:hypothetical protein